MRAFREQDVDVQAPLHFSGATRGVPAPAPKQTKKREKGGASSRRGLKPLKCHRRLDATHDCSGPNTKEHAREARCTPGPAHRPGLEDLPATPAKAPCHPTARPRHTTPNSGRWGKQKEEGGL